MPTHTYHVSWSLPFQHNMPCIPRSPRCTPHILSRTCATIAVLLYTEYTGILPLVFRICTCVPRRFLITWILAQPCIIETSSQTTPLRAARLVPPRDASKRSCNLVPPCARVHTVQQYNHAGVPFAAISKVQRIIPYDGAHLRSRTLDNSRMICPTRYCCTAPPGPTFQSSITSPPQKNECW